MERGCCSGSARAPSPQRPFPFVPTSEMHSPAFVCVPESCDLGKLLSKLLTQQPPAPDSVLSSLPSQLTGCCRREASTRASHMKGPHLGRARHVASSAELRVRVTSVVITVVLTEEWTWWFSECIHRGHTLSFKNQIFKGITTF